MPQPANLVDYRDKRFKGALHSGRCVGADRDDNALPQEPQLHRIAFAPKQQNTLHFRHRVHSLHDNQGRNKDTPRIAAEQQRRKNIFTFEYVPLRGLAHRHREQATRWGIVPSLTIALLQ